MITSDGSRYIPHHRVVHLDLKGAPPKLSYLKELFPVLRDAGATAILLGKTQERAEDAILKAKGQNHKQKCLASYGTFLESP